MRDFFVSTVPLTRFPLRGFIPTRIRRVVLFCSLAVFSATSAAWTRIVDVDSLARDLQVQKTAVSEIRTAFWIAPEFVEVGIDDPESVKHKKLMVVFDNHAVFMVSNEGVNATGVPFTRSASEVRGGTQLSINGAAKLLALTDAELNGEMRSGLEALKQHIQEMTGNPGDQAHLVLFRLPAKAGFPALYASGNERIKLSVLGEDFSWRLPLGGVLPPVVDRVTGEQFPGNFLFSPFSGRTLVPVGNGSAQAGLAPSYSTSYSIGGKMVADSSEVNNYLAQRIATDSRELSTGAAPAQPLRLLKGGPPTMPADAVDRKIEGTVQVELLFGESGEVEDVKILRTPHEVLSKAVIAAVSSWRIEPRVQDGKPRKQRTRQEFTFAAQQ